MTNTVYNLLFYYYICLHFAICSLQSADVNFKKKRARACVYGFFLLILCPILVWLSVALQKTEILCKIYEI